MSTLHSSPWLANYNQSLRIFPNLLRGAGYLKKNIIYNRKITNHPNSPLIPSQPLQDNQEIQKTFIENYKTRINSPFMKFSNFRSIYLKLPTKERIFRKSRRGNNKCLFCPAIESETHLFTRCNFVQILRDRSTRMDSRRFHHQ